MIRPCVSRLAAMPEVERIRVVLAALDASNRRVHGLPCPGMEPYAPDPRHRISPRFRAREAAA